MGRTLKVIDTGRRDYDSTWALQRDLHARAVADAAEAFLVLVEHDPVITLGRRADRRNLLRTPDELAKLGVEVREVDRGGDVTYHGPGQLVAYPIFQLLGSRRDVHAYFRSLEEAVIKVLADYGIEGQREAGLTGVWVGGEKVCAMGVAVKRWTTYHGLALNVNPDLSHFRLITPCGISDKGVTSMARLLGREVPFTDVAERLVWHFAREFEFTEVTR